MTIPVIMKIEASYARPKTKFSLTSLLTILFTASMLMGHAEVDKAKWTEGKSLFKSNCAACHNPKADGTGPALQGVTARWEGAGDFKGKTGKQWLYTWIHNWNDAVGGGYKYAIDMANSRPAAMNTFTTLKDADIDNILLYIENSDMFAAPTAASGPTAPAGGEGKGTSSPSASLYLFVFFLVVLVALLLGVTRRLDKIVADKRGEVIAPSRPFYQNPKWIVALVLIAIVAVGYKTVDWGVHLGRQQGYQPTQPIRFSHALHAGTHKIDCQYCHQTANKGKHSNIPSLNTCMNCHKNVSKGPKYGTEEIAKIYAAVGWDSYSGTYSKPAQPVEWVRIHNLPDHVYFNHAQHVNAGKQKCQTCHGPVETMEEVYQYAPLSMGWCINCHRNTEVGISYDKEKGEVHVNNQFYSTYKGIHEKLKSGEIEKVTVETIGGTECQRCHY